MTTRRVLRRIQRDAYLTSRTAGDLAAAQRGHAPLARRLGRRTLTRALARALRSH